MNEELKKEIIEKVFGGEFSYLFPWEEISFRIEKALNLYDEKAKENFNKKIKELKKKNKSNLYGFALTNANKNIDEVFF